MSTGHQLAIDGQGDALAAATLAHLNHLDVVRYAFDWWIDWTFCHESAHGFTAQSVRDLCDSETVAWLDRHQNLLPAMFGQASRANRIEAIGWAKPTRRSRHGSVTRRWKGTTRHA